MSKQCYQKHSIKCCVFFFFFLWSPGSWPCLGVLFLLNTQGLIIFKYHDVLHFLTTIFTCSMSNIHKYLKGKSKITVQVCHICYFWSNFYISIKVHFKTQHHPENIQWFQLKLGNDFRINMVNLLSEFSLCNLLSASN